MMVAVNGPGPGSKVTGCYQEPLSGPGQPIEPGPPVFPEGCEVTFDPGSPESGRRNVIVPERWVRWA